MYIIITGHAMGVWQKHIIQEQHAKVQEQLEPLDDIQIR